MIVFVHEMAIANDLIRQIVEAAEKNAVTHVREIDVEIGAMRQVVPEALQLAFGVVVEGTIAEGATLSIVEVPAGAECRRCGLRFEPAIDCYLCPRCNKADVRIVAGNDIVLRSMSCDTE